MSRTHLLNELVFPSRYEILVDHLGEEIARILVSPSAKTNEIIEEAGYAVRYRDEGILCPIVATSGTGKTTLASNLSVFFGNLFGKTLRYTGELSVLAIKAAVELHRREHYTENDPRVLPINIDHREAALASPIELAEIKQFLREPLGRNALVLWPTTERLLAEELATTYTTIAGSTPIKLPLEVDGPPRASWRQIATDTVVLVNKIDAIDLLVNPHDYDPDDFPSLGEFLRRISADFMTKKIALARSARKPLSLTILYASESPDTGVLSQLTSGSRFGLLDGNALVGVTPTSEVGKWWSNRRGLLTQTIVTLEAHALALPPTVTMPILRTHGPDEVKDLLSGMGVDSKGSSEIAKIIKRSDIGRHLLGEKRSAYETRGNPGGSSQAAYALIVEQGAIANGRDKKLNTALARMLFEFLKEHDKDQAQKVESEKRLGFIPLIPDVSIHDADMIHCIEFAWRKGDQLRTANRADVAIYALKKLRNYAIELGWVNR
ncbi:hypothetical protein ACFY2Q_09645 [Micromonospora sp. NPDC000316]|uniref:hypothetical protein n=1 Tax=Micromonospora sp. NPDC000316 TaxID=3364216 RepID=UPI003694037F